MPHPDIISYPLPRLLYISRNYDVQSVYQPKDYIYKRLTGQLFSDVYSWRGLANIQKKTYSKKLLDKIGIDEKILPKLTMPDEYPGCITKEAAEKTGLNAGTRVYLGCNDFFAGLLGMGIKDCGYVFDVTGTSEHIGLVTDELKLSGGMVSSPYFYGNVIYGVTSSCGTALDFGVKSFGDLAVDVDKAIENKPPIFLPYLSGERAPIWDVDARGTMFGISRQTDINAMRYAILEGVAFSAYHIYEALGLGGKAKALVASGGACENDSLNQIKADIFGLDVYVCEEKEASAYGACLIAAEAEGLCVQEEERFKKVIKCKGRPVLKERFNLYKKIYNSQKENFKEFRRVGK